MTKGEIGKVFVGSLAVVIIAVITAAVFIGGLEQRVTQLENEAVNLEDFVNAERPKSSRVDFANTVRWGEWSEEMFCPPNHYGCGLAQKAEAGVGNGSRHDDTAVNGIAFLCLDLPRFHGRLFFGVDGV